MKKTVGVTGASGFIGKQLIEKLLDEGYKVTVFTRSQVSFPKSVKVIEGDLMDDGAVRSFLKDLDTVVHLAARQLPPEELFFRENVIATNNLIKNMVDFPIKHMLFLSTIAVYGDQGDKVITENDPCSPNTSYGLSKYLAENLCRYWQNVKRGKLTILRPFNVYGKGSKIGVVYNIVKKAKEGDPIIIFGDGKQTRDFLYVEDVINAICLALKNKKDGIFNLGSGKETSLLELIENLKKVSRQKVKVTFEKNEDDKAKRIAYSVNKAYTVLGWKAKTSLKEGLQKLL